MTTHPSPTEDDEAAGDPVCRGRSLAPPSSTPAGKPKKATNAVIAQRVVEILRLRIDGAQFHDIRDYADDQARAWGVSDSQLKRYIEKSDERLREQTEKSIAKVARMHNARRESLYARALQAADFRTALAVLTDMAKLEGLYDGLGQIIKDSKEIRESLRLLDAARGIPPKDEREEDPQAELFHETVATCDFTPKERRFLDAEVQAEQAEFEKVLQAIGFGSEPSSPEAHP